MKLSYFLLTCLAFPAIAIAGITPSGSVLTGNGDPYNGSDPWTVNFGTLNIGTTSSAGSLAVNSGSSVTANSQIYVRSPTTGGSTSSLLVDGSGTRITTSSLFLDGGLLRVSDGATPDVGDLGSKSQDGRTAQTFIDGPGTVFTVNSLGFVGNGNSQISVTNGASMITHQLDVWSYGSSFSITVGGGTNTSQWLQNGILTMGTGGSDLIDIRGGGLVRIGGGSLVVGYSSTNSAGLRVPGTGTIRVDGTDGPAELQLQTISQIGYEGTGNLVVTNGGKVTGSPYLQLNVGNDGNGGVGRLSVGEGSNSSTVSVSSLQVSGTSSLIEVLDNGTLNVGSLRAQAGGKLVVGGGSAPAVLNLIKGPTPLDDGVLYLWEGSQLDVLQDGTVNALFWAGGPNSNDNSQVRLNGGMIAGGGFFGGLPVQILAGGGKIQTTAGNGIGMGATTGVGLLTKTGAGSMTFTGQTNHAATRVVEGSLNLAAGSRTTGTVEILAGAKLTGTGTLDGLLTLQQGAVIAPGNSPGILQTGSSLWTSGGRYEWEINNALGNNGINWDLVQINGSLDLVGLSPSDPFVIAVRSLFESNGNAGLATNFNSQSSYRFTILTTTSGIVGFDASDFRLDLTGFANADLGDAYWQLEQWNNGLDLVYNFAPVPEPGSALLIAVTALATLARRRRR